MGIAANQLHILGRDQKFYAIKESTRGTFLKPTAGSALRVLTTGMTPDIERKDVTPAYMATRDVVERITGRSTYAWNLETFYEPSGTKNVAPDTGPFIEAGLGAEAVNANDVTYSTSSVQTWPTLSITRHWREIYQRAMWGCWVEELTMKFAGGEEPRISASGGAMGSVATGASTLNGAVVASNDIVVQTVDKNSFGVNSVIQIDDQSDRQVTADASAPTFTVDGAALNEDNADPVTPYVPAHTTVGNPIAGIAGVFTWDALSFIGPMTAFEFTVKNNHKPITNDAMVQDVSDFIPGIREITGKISVAMRQDILVKILDRKEFATKALVCNVGGAAQSGTRLEVSMPYCEMLWGEVSVPEAEEATIEIPFKALGSSGDDAITLKHT